MRVVLGSIWHESNTFSPTKTDLKCFKENQLLFDNDILDYHRGRKNTEIGGILEVAENKHIEIIPTVSASAIPSGPVTTAAFKFLEQNLLERIQKAKQQIDGVLLVLHGAMVTEDLDDPEGYLLHRIREIVGSSIPIGVTLDHHANVSRQMVENADFLIGYRTHPHVDQSEVGQQAAKVMSFLIENEVKPVMRMRKLPALFPGESSPKPRAKLVQRIEELERREEILSASFFIGYSLADIKEVGPCAIVVTRKDKQLAEFEADRFAQLMWKLRNEFALETVSIDEGIEQALGTSGGPILFVDTGDCFWAGGGGDVPFFLQSFLKKGVKNAVIAVIVDLEAVNKCIRTGVGKRLTVTVGGKLDQVNAKPITVTGTARVISNGKYWGKDFQFTEKEIDMGPAIVLDVNGIGVVIVSKRTSIHDPAMLRSLNIEPKDKKIIVLKDGLLNLVTYKSIAKETIFFNSPGFANWDYCKRSYQKILRPIFPLDPLSLSFSNRAN
ncbi:hypothetical protein CEE35_09320 [Candidatus Aerophobetes bacterium Ae_b3b]|nr:MAG: hypothetical protein CEE35_09320 [Candidatus Aerophobetes bacterium Ae_b3b]